MAEPNQFKIEREIPFSELEDRLREVTLLGQPDIHPYEDADIYLERFTWDEVLPTSKYVLTRQLVVQQAISASLGAQRYHQLELEGGLIIVGGEKGRQGLVPPIVERFVERGRPDSVTPYILDGSHRAFRGRMEEGRDSFLGLYIRSGIRADCPPYAFPNTWGEVREVTELPENRADWKNFRGRHPYVFYRDFGPINGSTPRTDNT